MLKMIITAAIVLSVGILSLIKTSTPAAPQKEANVQLAKAMIAGRNVLATAD